MSKSLRKDTPLLPSASPKSATNPLADFLFPCIPIRLTKETPLISLRVRQIWPGLSLDNIQVSDLTVAPLLKKLQDPNLIPDPASQFLFYHSQEDTITFSEDEDVQNAV